MKRDKLWWAGLSKEEQFELMSLQMSKGFGGSRFNLPEGYRTCDYCSNPTLGGGMCPLCSNRHSELVEKANAVRGAKETS